MSKALILQCPGVVSGSGHRKLNNFVGIEFVRGASDGGGVKGYHKMIGDETLLETLPLFNQIHLASVKNAKEQTGAIDWTGSDGSDVMQVFPKMYAILGGSDATYERYIFSDMEFSYEGEAAKEIPAFAEAPDWENIINGISRSAMGLMGHMGVSQATNFSDGSYASGEGYPTVYTSRYVYEAAARAKNANSLSNLPYCNGSTLDLEVVLGILYVECRTKNFTGIFGGGVSADFWPSDENWARTSGIRTSNGAGGYNYYAFNGTLYVGDSKVSTNVWQAINGYFSLTKVLEVQKAIADGASLVKVTNTDGDEIGGQTGIYNKTITFNLKCALTADGEVADRQFEMHLCVPVWRGRTNLFGNIWSHLSGYDSVNYKDGEGRVHNLLYRAKSIADIMTDSDATVAEAQNSIDAFPFTSVYDMVGDLGAASGWMTRSMSKDGITLAVATRPGGAINNFECAYAYVPGEVTSGKYTRMQAGIFGGNASFTSDVPRFCSAYSSPSNSNTNIGSRFRVALS